MLLNAPDGDLATGVALLGVARSAAVADRFMASAALIADIQTARMALAAERLDEAITLSRSVLERQAASGAQLYRGVASVQLVEALLARGGEHDQTDARREAHRTAEALAALSDMGALLHAAPLARIRMLLDGND